MIPDDLVPDPCPWPIVLGIDPGTRVAGYGALVLAPGGPRLVICGTIELPGRPALALRLGHIQDQLEQLLGKLKPAALAIESAFAGRNVQSALRIGEARGVIIASAARRGVAVSEYAPSVIKKVVTGNGQASKEQVAAMVQRHLGCAELAAPLDATDALGVALAHCQRSGLLGQGHLIRR